MRRLLMGLSVLALLACAAPALAHPLDPPEDTCPDQADRSAANGCLNCHDYSAPEPNTPHPRGHELQEAVVVSWYESEHACSRPQHGLPDKSSCTLCHSPLQYGDFLEFNQVADQDWEHVTCGACHLPRSQAIEVGTRIGNYDPLTDTYLPRYLHDTDGNPDQDEIRVMCGWCHEEGVQEDAVSDRHRELVIEFQGYGKTMWKKGVTCLDCHMPAVPLPMETSSKPDYHSHNWNPAELLPWSCGVDGTGCHDNKTTEWALRQMAKGKIHADKNPGRLNNPPD